MNGAELQSVLSGIPLPATRSELLDYARGQDGAGAAELLGRLPEGEYRTLPEVVEALEPRQPRGGGEQELPRPESGLPPGGGAYVGDAVEPANVVAARSV